MAVKCGRSCLVTWWDDSVYPIPNNKICIKNSNWNRLSLHFSMYWLHLYCPKLLFTGKAYIWNSEAEVYFVIFCFFLYLLHLLLDSLQEILCAISDSTAGQLQASQAELVTCWRYHWHQPVKLRELCTSGIKIHDTPAPLARDGGTSRPKISCWFGWSQW